MPNTITIIRPEAGSVVEPNFVADGTFTLDRPDRQFEIRCFVIFPPEAGLDIQPAAKVEWDRKKDKDKNPDTGKDKDKEKIKDLDK